MNQLEYLRLKYTVIDEPTKGSKSKSGCFWADFFVFNFEFVFNFNGSCNVDFDCPFCLDLLFEDMVVVIDV